MSEFQIGLIVLGALFLVAVLVVNKAQERRVRRSVEQRFGDRRDVLLDGAPARSGERREPTLGGVVGEQVATVAAGMDEVEAAAAAEGHAQAGEPAFIDEEINVTVLLAADAPVSGERILAAMHHLRRAGRQAVSVVGASGDENWTRIRPNGRYDTVLVGVQLANRSGPLNEIEFSEFIAGIQQVADQIPASYDVPDMAETIARARALDARCAPLDAVVGINLVREEGSWAGDLIAQAAGQMGMLLRPDGRFHALDDAGVSLYSIGNGDGSAFRADALPETITQRLTFLLDVPQVARGGADGEPFTRMANAAQLLAGELGAVLVDDNMRPLTPVALAAIERQIGTVYVKLEAAGMAAGSPRAVALFG